MVYTFFDKKSTGGGIDKTRILESLAKLFNILDNNNKKNNSNNNNSKNNNNNLQLAEELHKPIIRKF